MACLITGSVLAQIILHIQIDIEKLKTLEFIHDTATQALIVEV